MSWFSKPAYAVVLSPKLYAAWQLLMQGQDASEHQHCRCRYLFCLLLQQGLAARLQPLPKLAATEVQFEIVGTWNPDKQQRSCSTHLIHGHVYVDKGTA